jgi:hypothetical protein
LNHIIIDSYEHLGKAIDYDEVMRFREYLKEKVQYLLDNPNTDSPLYSFFPKLNVPTFTVEEIKEIKENIEEEKSATELVEEAEKCKSNKEYEKAIVLLNQAKLLLPRNEFIIQRLVLVKYKSKLPNEETALFEAETILSVLNPEKTTDPETLGLAGAINKRLFEVYNDKSYLDKALWFYSRGFYIRQDYYNGINTAFLYNLCASIDNDQFESFANYGNAISTRKKVIDICNIILAEEPFKNRDDKHWIYLTLAEAYIGINEFEFSEKYYKLAIENGADSFSIGSYEEQIGRIEKVNSIFKSKWNIK